MFRSLAQRELLLPYLRNAVLSKNWPLKYLIEVDSSPYYGLDEDGTPDGYFHPSTHPLMGARQLYYLFHPDHRDKVLPEERDVQDEMGLAMGSALHAVVQTQFVQSGLLEESDVEVEYINHDHHVRGRIDFIIHHPIGAKVVTEFKTRNSRAFSFQKEILPEWDAQLSSGARSRRGILRRAVDAGERLSLPDEGVQGPAQRRPAVRDLRQVRPGARVHRDEHPTATLLCARLTGDEEVPGEISMLASRQGGPMSKVFEARLPGHLCAACDETIYPGDEVCYEDDETDSRRSAGRRSTWTRHASRPALRW